ncbi:MAG: tyrosine--tRNA ligase [Candidatus Colwellbacteria bacterium CG10_big_fil_rev_8_21_14_0_10_41_28]|uniref:Tyrosine--tRNA ligase n=1 Tax=Candidatus Colwellbacteria bacterium CG10_big_fil_rev_8_21_14_0_10_41_28 TaxID=1974539 RepID=A0A2H0VH47_9BACT|nr:MAG: tyrosine--tRNA ligase [Candidatus Colwellbacteria bacterium CG10_big_fil_rev_8_21_14_0_10_41_28]
MKSSAKLNKRVTADWILSRGVEEIIEKDHLEKALNGPKKLRVKLGIDPTSPDLHLGHAVVLRKLRQFQDLGHKAVLIIGDFTGKVGDPTDQNKERPQLTDAEIKKNMKKYLEQAGKIIDVRKTEIRHNSEWLGKKVETLLDLSRAGTIQQVLQRQDFRKRIDEGKNITLLETFYPLLQGFDSVNIKADIELGGQDQLLNLLMGRQVQRYFGMKEQDILTVPLIEGTDGKDKMSKSKNNYIAINDSPKDMFGKIMSIKDNLIVRYFILLTDYSEEEIKKIEADIKAPSINPMEVKIILAKEIVSIFHNEDKAEKARIEFVKVFRDKERPSEIEELSLNEKDRTLADLLVEANLAKSKSDAKRLIAQGGVSINGARMSDPGQEIKLHKDGFILQVGKRSFLKIKAK